MCKAGQRAVCPSGCFRAWFCWSGSRAGGETSAALTSATLCMLPRCVWVCLGSAEGILSRGRKQSKQQKYFEEASLGTEGEKMPSRDWNGEHRHPEPAWQHLRDAHCTLVVCPPARDHTLPPLWWHGAMQTSLGALSSPPVPYFHPCNCTSCAGQGNACP